MFTLEIEQMSAGVRYNLVPEEALFLKRRLLGVISRVRFELKQRLTEFTSERKRSLAHSYFPASIQITYLLFDRLVH